jgi:hypothetical protein
MFWTRTLVALLMSMLMTPSIAWRAGGTTTISAASDMVVDNLTFVLAN